MTKESIKELLSYIIIIVFIILIRTFIITPVRVNGISMNPTLKDKEIMILKKFYYYFNDINRFDIVVVKTNDDKIIKRVIGLPGEHLKVESNKLYIDGVETDQTFTFEKTQDFDIRDLGYTKLPSDCYFVMGDNRSNSKDSRIIGCVSKKQITGKTDLVILPIKNIGYRN